MRRGVQYVTNTGVANISRRFLLIYGVLVLGLDLLLMPPEPLMDGPRFSGIDLCKEMSNPWQTCCGPDIRGESLSIVKVV